MRLTAAQARQLKLDGTVDKKPSHRRTAAGPYHTRCCTEGCGEEFRTLASENRHLEATRHTRYELVLTFVEPVAP